MTLNHLAGALTARLVCLVAIAMAASAAIIPAAAAEDAAQSSSIGIVPTEERDDGRGDEGDPGATEEPSPPPTEPDPNESNGDSGDDEPPPTESPTEEPDSQQGDGDENDSVAPGFVTLVIFTSDGNPTSEDSVACVGSICQPAGGLASGTKVVFFDIDSGWREVRVETGFRGGNASATVHVTTGHESRVELTLVAPVHEPRDEPDPPPVSATGPLRTAPAPSDTANQSPWTADTAEQLPETASGIVVSSMPSTGAANQRSPGQGPLPIATLLAIAAFASGLAAHLISRSRPNRTAGGLAATPMPGYHRSSTVQAGVPGRQVRSLNGRLASSVNTEVTSARMRLWARGRRVRSRS